MVQGIVKNKIVSIGSRPDFWLAALLLWALASATRSYGTPWASVALTEVLRWGAGIGLALTLSWFLRRTEVSGQIVVVLAGVMALYGILGAASLSNGGLVGPYHDHQLYGSVLLLLLPFSASTAFSSKSAPWRWAALATLTAGTLCLLLSQTRSAWIGMAAAASVFSWLWFSRSASRPAQFRVVLIPAILLLLGLFCAWLVTGPVSQKASMTQRAATLTALSSDGSWQSRLDLWHGTAHLVAAHPVFGIGLGRYPGAQWLWTHSGGLLPPFAHPSLSNQAHSFYGQTAAELGLIGLGLYLAALAAFVVQGLRRLQRTRRGHGMNPQNALLIASLSALAGQGVDALASPSWQFPEVSFFFWGVLGLGLASLRKSPQASVALDVPRPLLRAAQWALSGSFAVVCATQILPFGLLTPVEAYSAPAGATMLAPTVSLVSAGIITSGSKLQFQVLANYILAGVPFSQDVTSDTKDPNASTTYMIQILVPAPVKIYTNSSVTNGAFTVPTQVYTSKSTLNVLVYYKDTGTGKILPSNVLPLTISP